jgi:hypothetical protein
MHRKNRKNMKRSIPDYETLELADPRDAVRASGVELQGLVEPSSLLGALISLCCARAGALGEWGSDAYGW